MKSHPARHAGHAAFNRLELMMVISVALLLGAILLTYLAQRRTKVQQMQCINNLKSVSIGFRLSTDDNNSYPPFVTTNEAWQYFQAVGSEIGSPKVLLCPADIRAESENTAADFSDRGGSGSFSHPDNRNAHLSYFYSPDAEETTPGNLMLGDRNLSTNDYLSAGLLAVQTNTGTLHWTKDMHREKGSIAYSDGSVQSRTSEEVRDDLKRTAFSHSSWHPGYNPGPSVRFVLP